MWSRSSPPAPAQSPPQAPDLPLPTCVFQQIMGCQDFRSRRISCPGRHRAPPNQPPTVASRPPESNGISPVDRRRHRPRQAPDAVLHALPNRPHPGGAAPIAPAPQRHSLNQCPLASMITIRARSALAASASVPTHARLLISRTENCMRSSVREIRSRAAAGAMAYVTWVRCHRGWGVGVLCAPGEFIRGRRSNVQQFVGELVRIHRRC